MARRSVLVQSGHSMPVAVGRFPLRFFSKNLLSAVCREGELASGEMNVTANPESTQRAAMERDTLRLLCSVLIKPGTRMEICKLLQPGVFLDSLRSTVFEEICALGDLPSRKLRELLPARVISRGFPDFDLNKLLAPKLASEQEIEKLFESALQLLKLGPDNEPVFDS